MDETAVTVLAGVKKNDRDVTIVVRPAYDGTVIIYLPVRTRRPGL
jgi:hypothetical protein